MFKYLFKKDTILATIMVFVVMGLLALIPINTHVLDPIKMALQDFDYNDLAYSKFNKNGNPSIDTSIVIVNIGEANRSDIASMIQSISTAKPAVIGVDILFNEPKDLFSDSLLLTAFNKESNIVLAYNLKVEDDQVSSIGFLCSKIANKGFANFVGEEGGSIRLVAPFYKNNEEVYQSFAAAVSQKAYPNAYDALKKRNNVTEAVNYTHTADDYIVVDGETILNDSNYNYNIFLNKLVLIGYISNSKYSLEDKHFTPLNKKSVGKTIPDMEGIFIHANIIQMVKDAGYIKNLPTWINWMIAGLLGWLHMSLFISYFIEKHIWFHLVAKIAQVLSAILFIYIGLLFYYKWNIRINLAPTFVAIILAVDVLYFYEAITAWLHKRFGYHSLFINAHHH
ncbi:MAG: CHASE2 domain-containing protein [Ferruginibacter sp.]